MKRFYIALVFLGLMTTAAQAVDITITFANATTLESRAAAWALAKANEARAAQTPPQAPYANVRQFLEADLRARLQSWIRAEAEANVDEQNIKRRWALATDAQRAAALAQLPALP